MLKTGDRLGFWTEIQTSFNCHSTEERFSVASKNTAWGLTGGESWDCYPDHREKFPRNSGVEDAGNFCQKPGPPCATRVKSYMRSAVVYMAKIFERGFKIILWKQIKRCGNLEKY